jgi:acetylcholinesterase
MVTNGGNPQGLFHGGFMESGSPIPVGDITEGQATYNQLMEESGCAGSLDMLSCLRQVPSDTLAAAINKTPDMFNPEQVQLVNHIAARSASAFSGPQYNLGTKS